TLQLNNLGDFHMHGEFRTNFLSQNYVNFSISRQSYFRILLDELAIADVDIYLWRTVDHTLVDYSVNYYEAEMIAALLGILHFLFSFSRCLFVESGDYSI